MTSGEGNPSNGAWYNASIDEFLGSPKDEVLGSMARRSTFSIEELQRDAWIDSISALKEALAGISGTVFLEFGVPRLGERIDAVVIAGAAIIVIEFKIGAEKFSQADVEQVWDYALDLKNFHEASHGLPIIPVLVASDAAERPLSMTRGPDRVYLPIQVNREGLRALVELVVRTAGGPEIDAAKWGRAPYKPTPTIVEAARAMFARHKVDAISCFDAGRQNLGRTSRTIEDLIEKARRDRLKVICFVTGVPGAGKTLVGLNVATRHDREDSPTHAVLLSGNGPLVAVLRAALTRDESKRRRALGKKKPRGSNPVKQFIQNVHHFRDEAARHPGPPADHVIVFDEAQRAWSREKTVDFMKRKKGVRDFTDSEPEYLLSYVDRHPEWAVVVCLVGGGQEIYQGEAGIGTWLAALETRFSHWQVYVSSRLTDSEYRAESALSVLRESAAVHFNDDLHLAVSMRSFRAENASAFVKALLDRDSSAARTYLGQLSKFPIVLTRDLNTAKAWVRGQARGSERYGLLASSRAQRLKPHAIDIRVKTDPVHWFLNGKDDTRSSYYLEDVATEFQVQGLEVDWACVAWDGDLRSAGADWSFHSFRGTRWQNINSAENRAYLKNAYRVLLTRARQGMVIFVPPGDAQDPTRAPALYDETFEYLVGLGIPVVDETSVGDR